MLSIRSASLTSGKIRRVDNVSLQCEPGRITALLGPNGAGKTTMLKLLSGELSADSGELTLNDRPTNKWRPVERARMVACLPQLSTLSFPFTVEEVVLMGRIPHNTGDVKDREIAHQSLESVDSLNLAERLYTELSGGEKQRVQLARVLAQIWSKVIIDGHEQSRTLLLDEPATSLDLAHQQLLKDIVRRMVSDNVSVVMVVHDLNIALTLADHMVAMSKGRLVDQGAPEEMVKGTVLQTLFGVDLQFVHHPKTGKPVALFQ